MSNAHHSANEVIIHRIEIPTPFPVGPVNAFLLIHERQRVLVDCGPKSEEAKNALLHGLQEHGLQPSDLTGLVLTHGHVDHVGLTALLQQHGVPVYAHPDVHTWLHPGDFWDMYRAAFFKEMYIQMGVPEDIREIALNSLFLLNKWNDRSVVNHTVNEGEVFPLLPQFKVVYVPGHAQAAIALWNPDNGTVVCGDQILPEISSNAFIEPALTGTRGEEADRTRSLVDYRCDLERWMERHVSMVYPGHGKPFTGAHILIRGRLEDQVTRADDFANLVEKHPDASAWDLALAFFPHHRKQVSLILSETVGYLDWLKEQGRVQCEPDAAGVLRWNKTVPEFDKE